MGKNQILAARLSFGFILFLGVVFGMLWSIFVLAPLHLLAGFVAFSIYSKSLPLKDWNLAKTAICAAFTILGFFSLLALGCKEEKDRG